MEPFVIESLSFHEAIIEPAFADILPQDIPFKGTLGEFTLMDNVPTKRPIVDIRRHKNILQRRDASCDIIYKKVFGASTRFVSTEELYAGTNFCRNEFYQGALKDFRAKDPIFQEKITPYFQQAVTSDITSNAYFGDIDRFEPDGSEWSTNKFDGIFKWIKRYITETIIPASQTIAIANGKDFYAVGGPADAFALIKSMYEKRPVLMRQWPKGDQAYYVTDDIASAYEDYLIATGTQNGNLVPLTNGINQLYYKGIPILIEPVWSPILYQIKGGVASAAILTLRGNFIFATDKTYGEGDDGKTALEIWYEKKEMTWYYRMFLKAGTQIALPEFMVVALSTFE